MEHAQFAAFNGTVIMDKLERLVVLRPIDIRDTGKLCAFHETLSDKTVKARWLNEFPIELRVNPQRIAEHCTNTDVQLAFVAIHDGHIVGVARGEWATNTHHDTVRLSVVVADKYQRAGIGGALLEELIKKESARGQVALVSEVLERDTRTIDFFTRMGFSVCRDFFAEDTVLMRK